MKGHLAATKGGPARARSSRLPSILRAAARQIFGPLVLLTSLLHLAPSVPVRAAELIAGAGTSLSVSDALVRGRAAVHTGDAPTALVQLRLALRQAEESRDLRAEAECRFLLGRTYRVLRRYDEALSYLRGALVIDERLADRRAEGTDRLQIGLIQRDLGRFGEAIRQWEGAAVALADAGDGAGLATVFGNLAGLERDLGRTRSALDHIDRARLAVPDLKGALAAELRSIRAGVLADLGRMGEALREAQDALSILAALPAAERSYEPVALHNHANLLVRAGDRDAAAALLRRALPALLDPGERRIAAHNLAALLLDAGRPSEAEAVLDAVASQGAKDTATNWLLRAEIAERSGLRSEAEVRRGRAKEVARESGDPLARAEVAIVVAEAALDGTPPSIAAASEALRGISGPVRPDLDLRAAWLRARVLLLEGRPALGPLREAASISEDLRRSLDAVDPRLASAQARARAGIYERLAEAELRAGNGAAAMLWLERLRSFSSPADPSGESDGLAVREALLGTAVAAAEREGDPARAASLRVELDTARAAFSETVDRLRTREAEWGRYVRVEPADVEACQRALLPGEALLQPILLPDRLWLLLYTQEAAVVREVPVGRDEVADRINRVVRVMRERRLERPERLREHLDQLGAWLLGPVAGELEGVDRLLVLADGPLRYIPPSILRWEGRHAAERWAVARLGGLASLRSRPASVPVGPSSLLVLSNPDGSLPAASKESARLVGAFPGTVRLDGSRATLSGLLAEGAGRGIVHFATHGVLDAQAPERSSILLAGDGEDPDPPLRYLEIPGLHAVLQQCRIVVLSACETAVPLAPDGGAPQGEGIEIEGLAQQFRRAGVPTLVASLWQVSDESTERLMAAFYEGLAAGRPPAEALSAAQGVLIARPETAHPFHWGAFVLIGR